VKLKKGKLFNSLSIGIASVWFAAHCGPGFASGTQELFYFVRHGWFGVFMPALSMTLVGIGIWFMLEHSRLSQKYSYRDIYDKATVPADFVLGKIYDIITFLTLMLAPAACLAAGGVLIHQYLGWSDFVGRTVMLLLTVVTVIFGAKVVRVTGTALTVAMIALIIMICGVGITRNWDVIANQISNRVMYTDYATAFKGGLTYFAFQVGVWTVACSAAVGIRYKQESKGATIIGIVLNSLMLMGVCTLMLGGMPTVATDPNASLLPTVYIVKLLNVPFFNVVYPILLFLALISTLVGFVLVLQTRLRQAVLKKMENDKLKNTIISGGFLIIVWAISQFGLIAIISKGYTYTGYITIVIWLLPMLVFGIKNLIKYRKLEKQGELPPGMDNRVEAEQAS